jgi:hypothetical protein
MGITGIPMGILGIPMGVVGIPMGVVGIPISPDILLQPFPRSPADFFHRILILNHLITNVIAGRARKVLEPVYRPLASREVMYLLDAKSPDHVSLFTVRVLIFVRPPRT